MRMRGRQAVWVAHLAAVVALTACGDPVSVQSDVLVVRRVGKSLELTNRSDAPLYHFVAERNILALLDWIPCSDPTACDGIEPMTTRRIPFADIIGYERGATEAVVYHWRLVSAPGGSGWVPDEIRSLIVPLR